MNNATINKKSNANVITEKRAIRLKKAILTSTLYLGMMLLALDNGFCMNKNNKVGNKRGLDHQQCFKPIKRQKTEYKSSKNNNSLSNNINCLSVIIEHLTLAEQMETQLVNKIFYNQVVPAIMHRTHKCIKIPPVLSCTTHNDNLIMNYPMNPSIDKKTYSCRNIQYVFEQANKDHKLPELFKKKCKIAITFPISQSSSFDQALLVLEKYIPKNKDIYIEIIENEQCKDYITSIENIKMTELINPKSMIRVSKNTFSLPPLSEIPDYQASITEHDLEKLLKLVDSNKNCKLKIGKNLYIKHKVEMDSKIESIFATANDDNIPKKLPKELLLKYCQNLIVDESDTYYIITMNHKNKSRAIKTLI